MKNEFEINKEVLAEFIKKSSVSPTSHPILSTLDIPAKGPLVTLAETVLDDFENTSQIIINTTKPRNGEVIIGHFGAGFDATPFILAIINWILGQIGDLIITRRKNKKQKQEIVRRPLTQDELREIRKMVIDFGKSLNDKEAKEVLTPEMTEKLADSIQRVLIQHPEALLERHLPNK